MQTTTLISFIIYLIIVFILGIIAYRQTHNLADYMLGGRRLGGGVVALSAGASDMSGWLLLGLPGALYASGLNQIWIAVGLIIGAYFNWLFVASRLRVYTETANNALTIPEFLHNRFQEYSNLLRIISALLIFLFFTFYVSSGLVSGAILFESSFGLSYTTALWMGAIVIMLYTFIGGFLAVSWTDVLQGILMLLALIVVPLVTFFEVGGWQAMSVIDPSRLDVFKDMSLLGIISLMAWGLGYFGQPHILVRFMAIKSVQEMPKARRIGMSWMIVSTLGAVLTGFIGIAYFADNPLENSEKVFLVLSQVLFNPWVAGFLLAAILSAIMSTIDSQLLVSSSAITDDFYQAYLRPNASQRELVWVGRFSVIVVAMVALVLAHNPDNTIMDLVAYAWAGFGCSFGPVIIFSLFWSRMTGSAALVGMIVGAMTVVIWERLTVFEIIPFSLYEMVPAFLLSSLAIVVVSWFDSK
ncbi:proline:sodium symporter PutP [Candidatus Thiomargarita nelsonii]|uniref:Sodium/proline symporter n=1 Tax=Candidatus Thiomargarita nelsonii TaxID=1003181 RepID=A0A4E0R2S8_9GAMM|nr:proline:sodium symporter PutP [Candidatus Thiomargarita nelsonii]